jgi:hypothetical protein
VGKEKWTGAGKIKIMDLNSLVTKSIDNNLPPHLTFAALKAFYNNENCPDSPEKKAINAKAMRLELIKIFAKEKEREANRLISDGNGLEKIQAKISLVPLSEEAISTLVFHFINSQELSEITNREEPRQYHRTAIIDSDQLLLEVKQKFNTNDPYQFVIDLFTEEIKALRSNLKIIVETIGQNGFTGN